MSGVDAQLSPEPSPALNPGELVVPGYRVIARLRQGRELDVYDVWSEERACHCVAKTVRADRRAEPGARERLRREGQLLQRLTHPHIVRAYETIQEPVPVLILETLTGATLRYLITHRSRNLPLRDLAQLGLHLCSAMHYLHRQGYLHLDLKPSNIVSERGLAKVLDLSIAQPPGRGRKCAGTRGYMAPEQCRCGFLTAPTDVWGIGMVLFEATTGTHPFDEEGADCRPPEGRATPVRTYRRVPPALARVVEACLDQDPAGRPTIDELSRTLAELR